MQVSTHISNEHPSSFHPTKRKGGRDRQTERRRESEREAKQNRHKESGGREERPSSLNKMVGKAAVLYGAWTEEWSLCKKFQRRVKKQVKFDEQGIREPGKAGNGRIAEDKSLKEKKDGQNWKHNRGEGHRWTT